MIQAKLTNSQIIGTVDSDTIIGNAGDDTIGGGGGSDSIEGAGGEDLIGFQGGSTVDGGLKNDLLQLFRTVTPISGGGQLTTEKAADVDGGAGSDTFSFVDLTQGVTLNLDAGTYTTADGSGTIDGIETVIGGSGDDMITS